MIVGHFPVPVPVPVGVGVDVGVAVGAAVLLSFELGHKVVQEINDDMIVLNAEMILMLMSIYDIRLAIHKI